MSMIYSTGGRADARKQQRLTRHGSGRRRGARRRLRRPAVVCSGGAKARTVALEGEVCAKPSHRRSARLCTPSPDRGAVVLVPGDAAALPPVLDVVALELPANLRLERHADSRRGDRFLGAEVLAAALREGVDLVEAGVPAPHPAPRIAAVHAGRQQVLRRRRKTFAADRSKVQ